MKQILGLVVMSIFFPVICAAKPPKHAGSSQIKVSPNVWVSKDLPDKYHGEMWAAADPSMTGRLLLTSMFYDPERNQDYTMIYASQDGGKTWSRAFETPPSQDPVCTFGLNGVAFFGHLNLSTMQLELYKSADAGKTWVKSSTQPGVDRSYITVDDSTAKFRGNVYIYAHDGRTPGGRPREFFVSASRDGGATFGERVMLPPPPMLESPGNGAVLSDGTFVEAGTISEMASGSDKSSQRSSLALITSSDGTEHLSGPQVIATLHGRPNRGGGGKGTANVTGSPYLAVDKSQGAYRDRLYLVWADMLDGRSKILFSYSADKGKTWSTPNAVDDATARQAPEQGPDSSMPAVAVNRSGVVGISWYDRRENPDNFGWRARFTASLDGGKSFMKSIPVSEALYVPGENQVPRASEAGIKENPKGAYSQFAFKYTGGDTPGIAADDNFHVFWTDTRKGIAQVWTSIVTVHGKVKVIP